MTGRKKVESNKVTPKEPAARLTIHYQPPGGLKPDRHNARTHTSEQIQKLRLLIRTYGFTSPVLVDEHGIIAGHARTLAAIAEKMDMVPTIVMSGLSPDQRRGLAIADNRVSLDAGWDTDILTAELEKLNSADFDMELTGFDPGELAALGIGDIEFEPGSKGSAVREIETDEVADRFWISIRGPLSDQARALQRLAEVMAEMPEISVELGTSPVDLIP